MNMKKEMKVLLDDGKYLVDDFVFSSNEIILKRGNKQVARVLIERRQMSIYQMIIDVCLENNIEINLTTKKVNKIIESCF